MNSHPQPADMDDLEGTPADDGITFLPDNLLLFHWSPSSKRRQIIRYGLRPGMRPVIHSPGWRAPYVCFADSPSWAWALSAGTPYGRRGLWDLWQTWSHHLDPAEVISSEDRPSGIHEVRTTARVYKRHLWYVGTREREA